MRSEFVVKSSLRLQRFSEEKLLKSLVVLLKDVELAKEISQEVIMSLVPKKFYYPSTRDIRSLVKTSLKLRGLKEAIKMLKRSKRKDKELNIKDVMQGYLSNEDWRVKENANVNYSLGGLILHNSGTITANYWLNEIYSPQVAQAHKSASFHIHDLSMFSGYCAGWSLRQLIREGLGGVEGKIASAPAKHLSTLIQQIVNFLGVMQNEWAGAQAFSSFDTFLAPFIKVDKLSDAEIKQCLQSFIYGVNTPSRWGSQAPFTNITLDWVVPEDLKIQKAVVGGEEMPFTYADCQEEMDKINKFFIELMLEGDHNKRGFAYPIPTYNITKKFNWDTPNAQLLFEMTAKYGTPYFQNFINSDLQESDVRSMCCRLQLDKRELRKRGGGLFGSDEFTGSIGVVTINLVQIAYLAKDKEEYFKRLEHLMELAKESLETKRATIKDLLDLGLFPYTKRYLKHLNNHFSTIGVCGMNEACINFLGKDITDRRSKDFAIEVLTFMRNKMSDFQEETGNLYNLEATPAESTAYRFARHDKMQFKDIIASGEDNPFYTNSTALPVSHTHNPFDALDHQDELQRLYTGGTVFHLFLGEAIKDHEACKELVRSVANNYSLPYFSISPTFSICPVHGYLAGEHKNCPKCKEERQAEILKEIEKLEKQKKRLLAS